MVLSVAVDMLTSIQKGQVELPIKKADKSVVFINIRSAIKYSIV
jgi:hypothetical protein